MNKKPCMSTCVNTQDYNKQMIEWQKARIAQLENAIKYHKQVVDIRWAEAIDIINANVVLWRALDDRGVSDEDNIKSGF